MRSKTAPVRSPVARATAERILDAAESCFAKGGYSGTSLRSIAERAGVTQPLISHYFGSKERLFEAVLERSVRDYASAQAEQFELERDDPEFFLRGLRVLFRWLGAQRQMTRLVQWARLEGRLPATGVGSDIWVQVRARAQALVDSGYFRCDLDVEGAMLMIDASMKGFWDRYGEYGRVISGGAQMAEPEVARRYERSLLFGLVRAMVSSEHQPAAEARLSALLGRPWNPPR